MGGVNFGTATFDHIFLFEINLLSPELLGSGGFFHQIQKNILTAL
jgi:Na+/phosphate symporter